MNKSFDNICDYFLFNFCDFRFSQLSFFFCVMLLYYKSGYRGVRVVACGRRMLNGNHSRNVKLTAIAFSSIGECFGMLRGGDGKKMRGWIQSS